MPADLLAHARAAKGFMPEDEGLLLYRVARERLPLGPVLEVGTLLRQVGDLPRRRGPRGRPAGTPSSPSTTTAARRRTRPAGSTTTPASSTPSSGLMDTLPVFRRTLARAGARGPGGRDRRRAPRRSRRTGARRCRCCSSTAGTPRSTPRTTTPDGPAGWSAGGSLVDPRRVRRTRRTAARRRTTSFGARWQSGCFEEVDGARLAAGATADVSGDAGDRSAESRHPQSSPSSAKSTAACCRA